MLAFAIYRICSVLEYKIYLYEGMKEYVYLMVFNATFNNISIISWRSVL